MEEIAVLFRFLTFVVDHIKSFGREQSGKHKQSAVLRTFDVQSLNFCLEGKTYTLPAESLRSFLDEFCWLFLHPRCITKQITHASIWCRNFEKIIDWTFRFWYIGKCTQTWDGFCFGFNHVLSRFYPRERIPNPVSVTWTPSKDKQMGFEYIYIFCSGCKESQLYSLLFRQAVPSMH